MAPKKSASRTAATGSSLETLFKKQRTDNELTAAARTATDLLEQAQIAQGEYLDKLESAKSHASATDLYAVRAQEQYGCTETVCWKYYRKP